MALSWRSLIGFCLLGTVALATAQLPGTDAPKLDIKKWIKGTEVKSFDPSKIYVVEFWATWCGPCKVSIPHLTETAHKNPDVQFIGVSVWEDDSDNRVEKFVTDMGDKMDYSVAYTGNQDAMAVSWLRAAGQNGIPSAFIVKGGKVQWIGHPMEIEEPLKKVKDGTLDVEAEAKKIQSQIDGIKKTAEARKLVKDAQDLYAAGKKDEAKKALDQAKAADPQAVQATAAIELKWLGLEDAKAFETKIGAMAKDAKSQMSVYSFAMGNLGEGLKSEKVKALVYVALGALVSNAPANDVMFQAEAARAYLTFKDKKLGLPAIEGAIKNYPASTYKDNAQVKTLLEKLKTDLTAL